MTHSNLKESTSLLCSVAVVTCCPGQRFVVVQGDHTLRRIMPNSARFRSAIFCFARIPKCCASPCSASLECSSGCDGGSCCELLRDHVNFYVRMRFRRTDRHTFTSGKRQDVMCVHVALFCVNGSKVPSPGKSCSVRRPGAGCLGLESRGYLRLRSNRAKALWPQPRADVARPHWWSGRVGGGSPEPCQCALSGVCLQRY